MGLSGGPLCTSHGRHQGPRPIWVGPGSHRGRPRTAVPLGITSEGIYLCVWRTRASTGRQSCLTLQKLIKNTKVHLRWPREGGGVRLRSTRSSGAPPPIGAALTLKSRCRPKYPGHTPNNRTVSQPRPAHPLGPGHSHQGASPLPWSAPRWMWGVGSSRGRLTHFPLPPEFQQLLKHSWLPSRRSPNPSVLTLGPSSQQPWTCLENLQASGVPE